MSYRHRHLHWLLMLLATVASGALAFSFERRSEPAAAANAATGQSTMVQTQESENPGGRASRNLSMQPEAFKLSRRAGKRFSGARDEVSVMRGTLIRDAERSAIQIVRRQKEGGERVEISLNGAPVSMAWSDEDGAKSPDREITEIERILIERLALDSLDQFVLAQLRGASYFTVARNVRPAAAGDSDNYSGPLWNIVRVDEPSGDDQKRPLSRSRLYYINTVTGMIDRIVAHFRGNQIEVTFSQWREQDGERIPGRIIWTRNDQTLMEFRLTSFSHTS